MPGEGAKTKEKNQLTLKRTEHKVTGEGAVLVKGGEKLAAPNQGPHNRTIQR